MKRRALSELTALRATIRQLIMGSKIAAGMVALLSAACGSPERPIGGECPVLPAVQARPAFEHHFPSRPEPADAAPVQRTEYILHADSGYAIPKAGGAHLCGVHLLVRDSLGRTVAEVTSATGDFDRQSETVVARGSVVVELPLQGRRLETEELHYAPRQNRVWSATTTTFREGAAVLTGSSFTADREFENIRLERATGRAPIR
jgi:hypothetical protein